MVRFPMPLRSASLVLLIVWLAVGCRPPFVATPPARLSNERIKDLHREIVSHLDQGDLIAARQILMKLPIDLRLWGCIKRPDVESMDFTYFFPVGEALQFFFWHRDVLSHVEITPDALNLIWQARLGKSRGTELSERDIVSRYFTQEGYRAVEQCGSPVTVEKPLVFFRVKPSVGSLEYGRVSLAGQGSILGREDITGRSPVFVDIPNNREDIIDKETLIVPGQSIGQWMIGMTVADLGRAGGRLEEGSLREAGWEDEIACCPGLIRMEWPTGLVALVRIPPSQVSREKLPDVTAEYLTLSSLTWEHGNFWTARGIGPWSSREDVVRAYGKPTAETVYYRYKGGRRLIYDEIGLAVSYIGSFHVHDLAVFRPGRARSIWKF